MEYRPVVAAFDNNPCKVTLDAITTCLGQEFPRCIDEVGQGQHDSCVDLVDWDFSYWMLFCVDTAPTDKDCKAQVVAAETCIKNCAVAGEFLSLQ